MATHTYPRQQTRAAAAPFKSRIAAYLIPISRAALRTLPFAQRFLWKHVIQGKLDYRSFEFVKPARFGLRFGGNIEDLIPRYLYFFGCWEPHLDALISRCLEPGDTFIDVGANVGYFSLLAAHRVGPQGRVFAFEACRALYHQLAANVELNHLNGIIMPAHVAVADREAVMTLHSGPIGNRGMASLVRDSGETTELVEAKPLSALLSREQLSRARLLKVDVEGAEELVLNGIDPVLPQLDQCDILLEINPELACSQRILDRLRAAGWLAYEVIPGDAIENYFHLPVQPKLIPLRRTPAKRVDVFLSRNIHSRERIGQNTAKNTVHFLIDKDAGVCG